MISVSILDGGVGAAGKKQLKPPCWRGPGAEAVLALTSSTKGSPGQCLFHVPGPPRSVVTPNAGQWEAWHPHPHVSGEETGSELTQHSRG